MSILDELKGRAEGLKDKADNLIGDHQEKIQNGITKSGDFIDDKTGGKFSGRIDSAQERVAGFVKSAGNNESPEVPER